ncbi:MULTISPECIES: hypothetical protein [Vibrio harveyi group]|uniref:hypothetical protein n=1 Tax=Vibrio harveyi group TaxID=717610 RepID=UPI001F3AF471|nr:hypothetical protein [Vibrio parahaemolyticus]MCG0008931.1 hypothetical protein [Vibrio parahaemolyticus]MDL2021425.1 hypothetical protein [Vibrio parahaemolyticus]MDL2025772.1 hypothetical protein [Vibrio parahaemolyticus]
MNKIRCSGKPEINNVVKSELDGRKIKHVCENGDIYWWVFDSVGEAEVQLKKIGQYK